MGCPFRPAPLHGNAQWQLCSKRPGGLGGSGWVPPNATRESVKLPYPDSYRNRGVGNPPNPPNPPTPLNGELPDDDLNSLAGEFWH